MNTWSLIVCESCTLCLLKATTNQIHVTTKFVGQIHGEVASWGSSSAHDYTQSWNARLCWLYLAMHVSAHSDALAIRHVHFHQALLLFQNFQNLVQNNVRVFLVQLFLLLLRHTRKCAIRLRCARERTACVSGMPCIDAKSDQPGIPEWKLALKCSIKSSMNCSVTFPSSSLGPSYEDSTCTAPACWFNLTYAFLSHPCVNALRTHTYI